LTFGEFVILWRKDIHGDKNTPAYLMHTDDREPIAVNGRPYMYYDARQPETLSNLMGAAINNDVRIKI
jgi:hypothetical protein